MVPIWNSRVACNDGGSMYVHCGPFRLIFGCCRYLQSVGVHLVTVQRHTLPRPVGGRRVGLLEQVALCLAQRRRRFIPLGSGGASARSAAAAILLARRRRSRLARRRRRSIRSAAARPVCGGGIALATVALIIGPGFGFCGTTLMVVLARSPGCPSRPEPAWTQGFPFPADNFPNELSTCL